MRLWFRTQLWLSCIELGADPRGLLPTCNIFQICVRWDQSWDRPLGSHCLQPELVSPAPPTPIFGAENQAPARLWEGQQPLRPQPGMGQSCSDMVSPRHPSLGSLPAYSPHCHHNRQIAVLMLQQGEVWAQTSVCCR